MKLQDEFALMVVFLVVLTAATVTNIANGGTNWDGPATNGKLIYTSAGSMIESEGLISTGANLDIINPFSTITPNSPSMLNLRGVLNNQQNGPHLQTYVNDSYPVIQMFSWSHDLNGFAFDSYLNSAANWISSDVGSNFRLIKFNDNLRIDRSAGYSQGSGLTWTNALTVSSAGVTTIPSAILTNSSIGSATINTATIKRLFLASGGSNLYYYGNYSLNASSFGAISTTININAVRAGQQIMINIGPVNGTFTSNLVGINLTALPSDYYPQPLPNTSYECYWPATINDNGIKTGFVKFSAKYNSYFNTYAVIFTVSSVNYSYFSAGSGRGWSDITVTFETKY